MKKWFKLTALLLSVVLSLSISAFAAPSAPSFTVEVDASTVDVGDRVDVTISMKNNPGVALLIFNLKYDTEMFECTESDVDMADILSDASFTYVANPSYNGNSLRVVAVSPYDTKSTGTFFTISFRSTQAGSASFDLDLEEVLSTTGYLIADTDNASITVKGQSESTDSPIPDVPVYPSATPEVITPVKISFSDVPETHWAHSYIQNVVNQGLFTGISNNQFGPDMNVTRGMFVTVLYSNAGAPAAQPSTFSDVAADAWYSKCVSWASEQGIVSGIGNNKFGPELSITREQLALILYQYAKGTSPGTEAYVRMFYPDGKDIHDWALTAMSWAVNEGLISGKTGNRLAPQDTATRAEVAVIMQNFVSMSK